MFASRIRQTVALPSDPSVTVTVSALGQLQADAARQASKVRSALDLQEMGGASFAAAMRELQAGKDDTPTPSTEPDPLDRYDLMTVLVSGVKGWTAPEPVNKSTLGDLHPSDAEFLGRTIIGLTWPSESEADRKNGSSPSIAV